MSDDGPTSPDDPEWVDEIVRRALERAGAADPSAPAGAPARTSAPPSSAASPAAPAQQPTTPASPPRPTATPPVTRAPEQPAATPPVTRAPEQPAATPPVTRAPEQPAATPPVTRAPEQPAAPPVTRAPDQPAAPHVTDLAHDLPGAASAPHDDRPRLPTPDDLVSAYPLSEPGQPDRIAGTRAGAAPAGAATMPYPDDDFDDARFDEAVGATFDQQDVDTDPIGGRMRGFLEWGAVVVGALAVALLIKTFLMQAYFIPSGSMIPTLEVGDRVLVNKLSYDFGDLGRGDLVVFNRPPNQVDGEDDLIKRVIALPGEVIEIRDGEVFITTVDNPDQQRLEEPYLAEGITTTGLVNTEFCASATATSCEIPEGFIFVMGDNRPGSKDSRVFGPISEDLVVGRAFLRVWPLGDIGFL